jgi:hypothetical protein
MKFGLMCAEEVDFESLGKAELITVQSDWTRSPPHAG